MDLIGEHIADLSGLIDTLVCERELAWACDLVATISGISATVAVWHIGTREQAHREVGHPSAA